MDADVSGGKLLGGHNEKKKESLASGEMKSPGGMRRELATPQLVHNSTLRPDHDMGTIKSG